MSNARKTLISALAIIGLLSSLTTPAFASPPTITEESVSCRSMDSVEIALRWTNTASAMANISVDETSVKSSVAVKAKNTSAVIGGTMYLEKSSGGEWVEVRSWPFSGTGSARLGKTYQGTSGVTYRTRAKINVTYNGYTEEVECESTSITV